MVMNMEQVEDDRDLKSKENELKSKMNLNDGIS